jgi:4-amino-4-deoxy-L-arabinose transferase-like glycosyltransferase
LSSLRRYFPLFTLLVATASFYLYNLNGVGLLGPDEPRYAAIGRTMAQTGDWITPRLWGSAWFEKPPLLYWMTAVATALGAAPEISARLPVALLSLLFLGLFCWLLAHEFGVTPAIIATATLATSAGWIAYSNLCLTDLPLACFFTLSIILLLPMLRKVPVYSTGRLALSAMCLGLAILAKGLVPIVLFFPVLWFARRYWRQAWLFAAVTLTVALPWYLLVYQRNGYPFIEDFILKQHFQRFYSPVLEHVHPWYYYVPVLLGILFPWTPLFVRLFIKPVFDSRHKLLLAICAFGFLFFSASLNKLNGYLLPLVPLLFILLATAFTGPIPFAINKRWLIPAAILISLIPLIALAIPPIMSAGKIAGLTVTHVSPTVFFYVAAPLLVILLARRSWTPVLLVLCVIGGGFFIKIRTFPVLDEEVSSRIFWNRQIQPIADNVCEEWIKRDWVYGLSFYRGQLIPPCYLHPTTWHLIPRARTTPAIVKK